MKTMYEPINADSSFKRSVWQAHPRWTNSVNHGVFMPVRVLEVLPSDRFKCDLRHYTRINQMIAPPFSDIYQHVVAFFVPKRIIWNKTKQFYGEAETFGVASKVYEPTTTAEYALHNCVVGDTDFMDSDLHDTFAHGFGLFNWGTPWDEVDAANHTPINKLPIWAFMACYNEYVRNENYQPKYMWNKDESGNDTTYCYGTYQGNQVDCDSPLPLVNKDPDIFTTILPYALKSSDPVAVPLGTTAPVSLEPDSVMRFTQDGANNGGTYGFRPALVFDNDTEFSTLFGTDELGFNYNNVTGVMSGAPMGNKNSLYGVFLDRAGGSSEAAPILPDAPSLPGFLKYKSGIKGTADLTNSAASLSSLIYALSYQLFLTKLAKGGSKYGEYLEVIFGAKCPAATRDEPEFLGHISWRLNVDTVLQTTGYKAGDQTELGAVGANSQTGGNGSFFNFAATEPGYLIICTYFKHTRSYAQTLDPVFMKRELLDYYQTPFANIPDVAYGSENIFYEDDKTDRTKLGFVEPWLEYKRFADVVGGILNPAFSGSADYWTLADVFDERPVITGDFLKEDRNAIARCLASGTMGPDYICDMIFDLTLARVMPLYSSGLGQL